MADSRRSALFTVLAVLFALAALEDMLKPLHLEGPTTGLVFFGTRLGGMWNAMLGPLLGIFLLIYAAGIRQMRRYALYLAYVYATYVTINLLLFTATNPPPASKGEMVFGTVYSILALTLTWGAAILLTRHRAELT